MAVDLGDRGFVHFPKRSHGALKTFEHPCVVVGFPERRFEFFDQGEGVL
jgi:hypothetical protein